ncbi:MAG: hypothetical protein WCX46_04335 [Candidatus Paceibacterota bacterium]
MIQQNEIGRICTNCNTYLPWEMFSKNKLGRNNRDSRCKKCIQILRVKRNQTPERKSLMAEKQRLWRLKNPDKALSISRRSYIKTGRKQNDARNWRYHNDPIYRAKKDLKDRTKKRLKKDLSEDRWNQFLESRRKYVANMPEHVKDKLCISSQRYRDNLRDAYVLRAILHLPSGQFIEPELLESQKLILQIKREVKKRKNETNFAN